MRSLRNRMTVRPFAFLLAFLLGSAASAWTAESAPNPDEVDESIDRRIAEFRHNRTIYLSRARDVRESIGDWNEKADAIRRRVLVATGLVPMPEKTPLNVKRYPVVEKDEYTIEAVAFESVPGFFVTGNLYMPRGKTGPFPGMLCPHGHWGDGRLADEENGSVPGRCINFARQGYVVFAPSMIGYNDSTQLKHHFDHPLWGLSLMGLQTWNNIRAIDFLLTLDAVDPDRIGCTGASGGGTQTFILAAIDDRVKVAVPVCMVSAHFQGGCECENAPLLRTDTNNVEIAATAAPRPYMLVGATGDWTKDTMEIEGPSIQAIYRRLEAPGAFNYTIVDSGHNYNKASREHVYRWMGRWLLGITDAEKLREEPYEIPPQEQMLVFNDDRPRPDSAKTEEQLRDHLVGRSRRRLEAMKPIDHRTFVRFEEELGAAFRTMIPQPPVPRPSQGQLPASDVTKGKGWSSRRFPLRKGTIPAIEFFPKSVQDRLSLPGLDRHPDILRRGLKTVRVIHPDGIRGLVDEETGEPNELVRAILDRGYRVEAIDCFLTGDHMGPDGSDERALPDSHVYTYNPTTLGYRVQDILTGLDRSTSLIGIGEAGTWCLLAAACSDGAGKVAVDLNGFDDDDEASWHGEMFQPHILKYGGLRTAASLAAPTPLFVHNTQDNLDADWVTQTYWMGGAKDDLVIRADRATDDEVVEWLVNGQ